MSASSWCFFDEGFLATEHRILSVNLPLVELDLPCLTAHLTSGLELLLERDQQQPLGFL